jgi:hypothetical protein
VNQTDQNRTASFKMGSLESRKESEIDKNHASVIQTFNLNRCFTQTTSFSPYSQTINSSSEGFRRKQIRFPNHKIRKESFRGVRDDSCIPSHIYIERTYLTKYVIATLIMLKSFTLVLNHARPPGIPVSRSRASDQCTPFVFTRINALLLIHYFQSVTIPSLVPAIIYAQGPVTLVTNRLLNLGLT